MSGQVKQEGPSCWVWRKGAQEVETECVEVDVEFEDLGEDVLVGVDMGPRIPVFVLGDEFEGPSSRERENGFAKVMQAAAETGKHIIPPDIFPAPQSEGEEDSIKFKELYGELCREREALAKCHELIQEQASKLGEEMLARVGAEQKVEELLPLRAWKGRDVFEVIPELMQQLKIMTEDRDEYQAKYLGALSALADEEERPTTQSNAINPEHYKQGGIECIDAIEAALGDERFRGYCQGNAIKYLWRHEHKGQAADDLAKAVWYTERLKGEM